MHPKYWKQCRNHVMRKPAEEGESGGGALDTNAAADAFGALFASEEGGDTETTATDDAAAQFAALDNADDADDAEDAGDEGEQEEGDEQGDGSVTVEVDGKPVTLTAEQIAEAYKNGLRQKDYTQKTMEAAELRKTADAEIAKTRSERDTYAQQLNVFALTAEAQIKAQREALTEELLESNPVEYLMQQRSLEQGQAKLQQAQAELQRINSEQQHEREQAMRDYYADQQAKLFAKVPAWNDPKVAEAEAAALKDYLGTQDFAPDERQFPDHRLILLARKAMQYDQMVEKAKAGITKVRQAPAKVERSGTPIAATDGRTRAMKQLGKTGSINDAAAAFAALG